MDAADPPRSRVFLLSPARSDGARAARLLRRAARFDLARRLRSREGAPLGEVYAFLSSLYFRGKLAYAEAFGRAPARGAPVLVITPGAGLLRPQDRVTADDLRAFRDVPVDARDVRYREPFERTAARLRAHLGPRGQAVLLGSIATDKYLDVLLRCLGERLLFPRAFVGRGDMSRGGLLLRAARESRELEYVEAASAVRTGRRPPRLARDARPPTDRLTPA